MATSRATGRALARRLLEVSDLRKHYHARAGLLASLHGQTRSVPAVDGVSFALTEHETLGLVGESGCGKRSEEHTSELQSRLHLVCRLLLEKKKKNHTHDKARD